MQAPAFLMTFMVALVTMPQGTHWLDSPEFVAGATELGVVHPPGHPLYAVLARAFELLLPIGPLPFRLSVLSALFAGVAAALFAGLARRLVPASLPPRRRDLLALVGALALGLAPSLWLQAQRAEVYTLNLALVLLALDLALRDDARCTWLAGLVVGLGLAHHHYLVVLCLPALAVPILVRGRPAAWLGGAVAGLVGLAAYAYLPLRGRLPLVVNWARPGDWGAVWDTVAARVFQASVGQQAGSTEPIDVPANLVRLTGMLADDVTWPGLALAVAGLVVAWRRSRVLGASLGLLAALAWMAKGVMEVDALNPDDHGYLLPGLAGVLLLATLGLGALAERLRIRGAWAAPLALAGVAGLSIVRAPSLDLRSFDAPDRVYEALECGLAPGGAWFTWYFPLHFLVQEKQVAEGWRPDLAVLQQSLDAKLRGGGATRVWACDQVPALAPLLDEVGRGGGVSAPGLEALRATPAWLEPAPDPWLDARRQVPAGWLFRDRDCARCPDPFVADAAPLVDALRPWLDADRTTRRVLTHLAYAGAATLAATGRRDDALLRLDLLLELQPELRGRLTLETLPRPQTP
jgi:hypothetical protein